MFNCKRLSWIVKIPNSTRFSDATPFMKNKQRKVCSLWTAVTMTTSKNFLKGCKMNLTSIKKWLTIIIFMFLSRKEIKRLDKRRKKKLKELMWPTWSKTKGVQAKGGNNLTRLANKSMAVCANSLLKIKGQRINVKHVTGSLELLGDKRGQC